LSFNRVRAAPDGSTIIRGWSPCHPTREKARSKLRECLFFGAHDIIFRATHFHFWNLEQLQRGKLLGFTHLPRRPFKRLSLPHSPPTPAWSKISCFCCCWRVADAIFRKLCSFGVTDAARIRGLRGPRTRRAGDAHTPYSDGRYKTPNMAFC
jgi:hypothetical protein